MTTTRSERRTPLDVTSAVSLEVQGEIERFLVSRGGIARRPSIREWYHLLANDLSYFMPDSGEQTSREMDKRTP